MAKKKSSPKRKAEGETEIFHKNNVVSDTGEEEEDEVIFVGGEFVKPLGDQIDMIPEPEIAISETFSLNQDGSDSEASYDCEYLCSRDFDDDPGCRCRLNSFGLVTDLRPDIEYFSFNTGLRAPLDSDVLKFGRALVDEGVLDIEDPSLSDFLATCTEPGEYESEDEVFQHSCGEGSLLKEPVLKLVKLPLLPQDKTVELTGGELPGNPIEELLDKQKLIKQGLLPPTALSSYQYYLLSLHEKNAPRKRYFTKKSTGGKAYLKAKVQRIKPGPKCFKDRMMEKLKEKPIKVDTPAQKEKVEEKDFEEEIEGLKLCLIDGDIVPVRRSKRHDKKANTETLSDSISDSKENKIPDKCNKKDSQNETKNLKKKSNGVKKTGMKKLKTSAQTEISELEQLVGPAKVNRKENKEVLIESDKSDLPSEDLEFQTSFTENVDIESSDISSLKAFELDTDTSKTSSNAKTNQNLKTKPNNLETNSDITILNKVKNVKRPVETDSDVESLQSSKEEKLNETQPDESFLKSYIIKESTADESSADEVTKLTIRVLRTRKVTENNKVKKRVKRSLTKNVNYAEPEDESKSSEESIKGGSITSDPPTEEISDEIDELNVLSQCSVDNNKNELELVKKNDFLKEETTGSKPIGELGELSIVDKEEEKENLCSNNTNSLCIKNKESIIDQNMFFDHKEVKSKEELINKDCAKMEDMKELNNAEISKGDHSFDKDSKSGLPNESETVEKVESDNIHKNSTFSKEGSTEIELINNENSSSVNEAKSDVKEADSTKPKETEMSKQSDTLKLNLQAKDEVHTPVSSPRNEDIMSPKVCRDPRLRARMMSRDEELRLLNIKQDAINKMEAESQRRREEEEQLKKKDLQKKEDQEQNSEEKDHNLLKKTDKKRRKSVDSELLYKTPLSDLHSEKEENFSYNRTLPKKQIALPQRGASRGELTTWEPKKLLYEDKKHFETGNLEVQQRRVVLNLPYKDTNMSPDELYDLGLPSSSRDSSHIVNYRNDNKEPPSYSYNARQSDFQSPLHQPDYRSSPIPQTERYLPAHSSNYYPHTTNMCNTVVEQNYCPVRKEVHLHFHQSENDFSTVIQQIPPVSEAPCPASPDQLEDEPYDRQDFNKSYERRKSVEYHYKDRRPYDDDSRQFYTRRHERREDDFHRRDKPGYHKDFSRNYDNSEKHYKRRSYTRQYYDWKHRPSSRSRSRSISPPRYQRSRSPIYRRRYDSINNSPDYTSSVPKFRRTVYTSKMTKFL